MPKDTRDQILEAAVEAAALYGLARLTLADVAKRADLSRQTLYRYFPTRDDLITAAVVREEKAVIRLVDEAIASEDDLERALEIALLTTVRAASEHPLLQRLIQVEPEALMPFLMTGSAPVVGAARPSLTRLITERRPDVDAESAGMAADSLSRLLVSWIVNPPTGDVEHHARLSASLFAAGVGRGPRPVVGPGPTEGGLP